ncbi:BgTH12-01632 [Blumeria graminis f. sp. triticale]|uniref:BgTH12-01632 n=1 Tax=Blumeria graminis f. sp. triticale TaxID=1689686 RepID=A0A9W4GF05_BLUGR|nr:BgTH12-01632 [Blumeria graminis f. sp. triticale]
MSRHQGCPNPHSTREDRNKSAEVDIVQGDSLELGLITSATSRDVEIDEITITAGQKMLSAMSGSLLTSLLMTPLDVVRIRLQSQTFVPPKATPKFDAVRIQTPGTLQTNLGVSNCCREVFFASNNVEYCLATPRAMRLGRSSGEINCAWEEVKRKSFNSTFDGLRKIARDEGFTTLWRGLSPTLVMNIPANIIYFTGYDWLRYDKTSPVNKYFSETWAPLVAGSTARMMAGTVVSPIEMFRTRIQARKSIEGGHFAKTIKGIKKMVSRYGYTSLWRGLTLTLWRDVPFSGIYWWGYETIRGKLRKIREGNTVYQQNTETGSQTLAQPYIPGNHTATFTDSFIAGATSGAIASILTMPFDVGKTRQQVFAGSKNTVQGAKNIVAPEERPMIRFLWHIFQSEGVSGLCRGWIPRTLKVAPACAIMISCYEVGKRLFRNLNSDAAEKKVYVV